jgi:hypothetical protein
MELLATCVTLAVEPAHVRESTLARGVINVLVVILTTQPVHVRTMNDYCTTYYVVRRG